MKTIAVHGLYRSGTNYFRSLLKANLQPDWRVLEIHEYNTHRNNLWGVEADVRLVVYKSIFQWIDSLARVCYDLPVYEDVLYDFEVGDHPIRSRIGIPITGERLEYVHLSTRKLVNLYRNWWDYWETQVPECGRFSLNQLYTSPALSLIAIRNYFDVPLVDDLKLRFDKVPSSDSISRKFMDEQYCNMFNVNELSDKDVEWIRFINVSSGQHPHQD